MQKLNGKTALITGGTSGIGLATAKLFHAEGAKVIITGRSEQSVKAAKQLLPNDVTVLQSDASSVAEIECLVAELTASAGKLDVLFLNAGVVTMKPLEFTTEGEYDNMFNVNLKGLFFMIQKSLPLLTKGASVILTSSIAGHKGSGMMAAYSASKAGVRSLAGSLGAYLGERSIRVNSISPGLIHTPILEKSGLPQEVIEGMVAHMNQTVPILRVGQPEEIAKLALFLASDESSYITGTDIVADGGFLAA